MRRLALAPNIVVAQLWADMLCQAGFDTTVQRYFISSIAGDVPPDQCAPELWLSDETQHHAALEALQHIRNPPQRHWVCRGCNEVVEGGFMQCWKCGLDEGGTPAALI